MRTALLLRAAAPAARRGGALRGVPSAHAAAAAAQPQPPPPASCARRRAASRHAATWRGARMRAAAPATAASDAAQSAPNDDAPHPALSPTHPALANVAFVLCEPGGPANVGGTARVLQNFGLSDLRVVAPGAFVVADAADAASPFVPEAYEYAVSAGWLLDSAARHAALGPALADATLVIGTSARARDPALRPLTPRAAAALAAAEAARGGRAVFLFGAERTGLRNEHLALAHALVAIPTAAPLEAARAGSGGRFSLNLSHAVAVLAYEAFQAALERSTADSGAASPPLHADSQAIVPPSFAANEPLLVSEREQDIMSTEARGVLVEELVAARGALALFGGGEYDDGHDESAERRQDAKLLSRALSLAPMPSRDAAPLFAIARRVRALAALQGHPTLLDAPALAAARAALAAAGLRARDAMAAQPGATPSERAVADEAAANCERALKEAFRAPPLRLNLSRRELRRLVGALAAEEHA